MPQNVVAAVMSVVKNPWSGIIILAFAAGVWYSNAAHAQKQVNAALASKADTTDVLYIRRELQHINAQLDSIETRQQQFFCADKPAFCR